MKVSAAQDLSNKTIQTVGSQYKKHLLDFDILTTLSLPSNQLNDNSFLRSIIKDRFAFKDQVDNPPFMFRWAI